MIVDPGDDAQDILATLERNDLTAKLIVLTHEHIDHIGAVEAVREATGAGGHARDRLRDTPPTRASMAMMWLGRPLPRMNPPEVFLEEGQEVQVGKLKFQVLFCPGHTPGHICLYGEGVVFTGDVLFQLSIGRFDLPGGDGRSSCAASATSSGPCPTTPGAARPRPRHHDRAGEGAQPLSQVPPRLHGLRRRVALPRREPGTEQGPRPCAPTRLYLLAVCR